MPDDPNEKPTRRLEALRPAGTAYSITRTTAKVDVSVIATGKGVDVQVGSQQLHLSVAEARRLVTALLETLG